jgi:ribosomal protein S25
MTGQTIGLALPTLADEGEVLDALNAKIAEERDALAAIGRVRREHERALARLEASRRALTGKQVSRRPAVKAERTALQRAGKGNVEKVLALLRREGAHTRGEITQKLGMNNGTVTWAIRHLEEQGKIKRTGEQRRGSDEFQMALVRRAKKRERTADGLVRDLTPS